MGTNVAFVFRKKASDRDIELQCKKGQGDLYENMMRSVW